MITTHEQIEAFKAGQAYERGILRRVLHDRPGLLKDGEWWKLNMYMEKERKRNPQY